MSSVIRSRFLFVLALAACTSRPPDVPVLGEPIAGFAAWYERYEAAPAQERARMEAEGEALAHARSSALYALIAQDPQRVLEERHDFPLVSSHIASHLERWSDGIGALWVLGAHTAPDPEPDVLPDPNAEELPTRDAGEAHGEDAHEEEHPRFHYRYIVDLAGASYDAYVYGRRLPSATAESAPLHGIAIGDRFALSDSPIRRLRADEALASDKRRLLETSCGAESLLYADFGETIRGTCNPLVLDAADALPPETSPAGPGRAMSTMGSKSLLFIIVDFSDRPGAPLTQATAQSTLDGEVNAYFRASSYDQASLITTVTPTLRMPQTAAAYEAADSTVLLRDARTVAAAAGYAAANYALDVVAFAKLASWRWSGQGYVGGKGTWLNGSFSRNTVAHELGHNFGAHHANLWVAAGPNVVGAGNTVEYGNAFEVMGRGSGQFGAWTKSRFGWIPSARVTSVTQSGTYTLSDLTAQGATTAQAIKIAKDATTSYWLEFRPNESSTNVALQNGAVVTWGFSTNKQSQLIDMVPSTSTANDAPLVLGRTLSDPLLGMHVTPIAKRATSPASLEVVINLGAFSGNAAPNLALSASAQTAALGQAVTFTATATDPNGDALAYFWDFGDGTVSTNAATQTRSWTSARAVPARVTVSDMKGQSTSATLLVSIGSPRTVSVLGRVLSGSAGVVDVKVSAGSRTTTTDSAGRFVLTGLSSGTSYTFTAAKSGYGIVPSGFANPLRVGASTPELVFSATAQ